MTLNKETTMKRLAFFLMLIFGNQLVALQAQRAMEKRAGKKPQAEVKSCNNLQSEALLNAASLGDLNELKRLLNTVDVNTTDQNGNTALYEAVMAGRENIIDELLNRYDININLANNWGRTCLHEAATMGLHEIVRKLCDHSTFENANPLDGQERAPLHEASLRGHIQSVEILLKAGAKSDIEDAIGSTALNNARIAGHQKIVRLLQGY